MMLLLQRQLQRTPPKKKVVKKYIPTVSNIKRMKPRDIELIATCLSDYLETKQRVLGSGKKGF